MKKTSRKPESIDAFIGARIRTIRLSNGASQTELGDKLGVSYQQVQAYENGSVRLPSAKLCKAAKWLGVPVQSFFPPEYTDTKQLDIFQNELLQNLVVIADSINVMIKKLGGRK